jgi:1-phosphatidylinositol-4-phosphate 5-kinase
MAPGKNDDGSTNIKDGHSSAPSFDYRASGSAGFDYRMNEDDPLSSSFGAKLDYGEEEGAGRKSAANNQPGVGFEVGYLAPDQRAGLPTELLTHLVDTEIADDTEAAEALRANAGVKVGKVGKIARSVGAQSVRKVAKRLTLRGQNGNRRGKPPRIPPGMTASQFASVQGAEAMMLAVAEAAEDGSMDSESINGFQEQDNDLGPHDIDDSMVAEFEGEGSKSRRFRHSSVAEDGKDIPVEVVAATMDAGRKLMGAIDPHNMLQLQRWRRKNKKGKKDKRKSYVKGKVIDGRHELYTLSIAVMLGVRTSIARTNTIIASSDRRKVLTPQDFMAEEKYEFAPNGSPTTPPHKLSHTFKFKDYAPVAFAYLRRMFGVNEFDFLLSVCGNANFIEFISNAKSGQFFFYSSDGKYMIKTMTNEESKFLRRSE